MGPSIRTLNAVTLLLRQPSVSRHSSLLSSRRCCLDKGVATTTSTKIETAPPSMIACYRESRFCYSTTPIPFRRAKEDHDDDSFASEFEEQEDFEEQEQEIVDQDHVGGPNPGLESVIRQGMPSLNSTATHVHTKTKMTSLSNNTPKRSTTTPRQLAESQRILDVTTECLDEMVMNGGNGKHKSTLLAIRGEPIALLEVEVNSNARQAKVYWTLPYGILTDVRLTPTVYQTLMHKIQQQFMEQGAGNLLAGMVHTRLRFYYPPRLKFHPAPSSMVVQAMEELRGE